MVQLKILAVGNTVHSMSSILANIKVAIFRLNDFGGGFGSFCIDPTLNSLQTLLT
jgi:hypothetical protein